MDGLGNGINDNVLSGPAGMPVGLSMILAQDKGAMDRYAGMTEAQKEDVILRAKAAASREEMERIVSSLSYEDEAEIREVIQESEKD